MRFYVGEDVVVPVVRVGGGGGHHQGRRARDGHFQDPQRLLPVRTLCGGMEGEGDWREFLERGGRKGW